MRIFYAYSGQNCCMEDRISPMSLFSNNTSMQCWENSSASWKIHALLPLPYGQMIVFFRVKLQIHLRFSITKVFLKKRFFLLNLQVSPINSFPVNHCNSLQTFIVWYTAMCRFLTTKIANDCMANKQTFRGHIEKKNRIAWEQFDFFWPAVQIRPSSNLGETCLELFCFC